MFDLSELHPQLADLILRGRLSGRNSREFFDLSSISRIGFSNSR
jgi:hypothetical protein